MTHPRFHQRYKHINQKNFALAIAVAVLAAIFAFFIYEFKFLRAPFVNVTAPEVDILVEADSFLIKGQTDADADLTLNGRPLYSGETGEFTERVYLVSGVNKLEFEAKNRYGRITKITRYIVVK